MTSKSVNGSGSGGSLEFVAMFDAMSPSFRTSVVSRALRARDHVSTEAGRSLDSAIRGSIRLVGYSNPALAISSALLSPVSDAVTRSEKLAGATLQVWAESLEDLEKLVAEHLERQDIAPDYPDLPNSRFRGFWDEFTWRRQLDWVVEFTEDWDEDDIALMLCYVSGKAIMIPDDYEEEEPAPSYLPVTSLRDIPPPPAPPPPAPEPEPEESPAADATPTPAPDTETPEPPLAEAPRREAPRPAPPRPAAQPSGLAAKPGDSSIMSQCIDYLRSLTPEDGSWRELVPDFLERVEDIRVLKEAQRERRAKLATECGEIAGEFAQDLQFLEQDISSWTSLVLTDLGELDRTLELAGGLKRLLTEYQDVRRPGSTLSEELSRRERRFALEPRILDTMGRIEQSLSAGRKADAPQGELVYEPVEDETDGSYAEG